MELLRYVFLVFFIIQFAACDEERPKHLPRSRYSLRKTTTEVPSTTTELSNELSLNDSTTSTTEAAVSEEASTTEATTTTIEPSTTIAPSTSKATKAPTKKPLSKVCGVQIGNRNPWIAVLEHIDPTGKNKRKSLSKGVLITDRHILTTVSSIHNSLPFWIVNGVRLGDGPTWDTEGEKVNRSGVVTFEVEELFKHDRKDIAIIKMSQPVNFTDSIRPICLPKDDNFNFRELFLHVCTRRTSSNSGRPKLPKNKLVGVNPLSPHDCLTLYRRHGATISLEEFCGWDETGDTCTGDLGGPLIGKVSGRFHVIGLHSYVKTKEAVETNLFPGIYARVGSHLNWINTVLEF